MWACYLDESQFRNCEVACRVRAAAFAIDPSWQVNPSVARRRCSSVDCALCEFFCDSVLTVETRVTGLR